MVDRQSQVSVVIPCYNGERFIADAIGSILGQNHGKPEVIVVDDGSRDRSREIVGNYVAGGRVTLVQHEANRGIAAARNTGIQHAAGEWVGFLDQDDLWRADKLAKQLDRINQRIDVIFSNVDVHYIDRDSWRRRVKNTPKNINDIERDVVLAKLLVDNFMAIGTALIRKKCFDEVGLLDENIRGGSDDFEFFVRLAPRYRFCYVDESLMIKREHGENYTDPEKMMSDALKILERVISENPNMAAVESRARSGYLYRLGRDLHAKGQRGRAMKAYKDSIRARPVYLKPLAALILCRTGKFGDRILKQVNAMRVF